MTNRLKIRITGTEDRRSHIYWSPDTQEYIVKLFVAGIHYEPADYFTTDEDDALGTAQHMCTHPTAEAINE